MQVTQVYLSWTSLNVAGIAPIRQLVGAQRNFIKSQQSLPVRFESLLLSTFCNMCTERRPLTHYSLDVAVGVHSDCQRDAAVDHSVGGPTWSHGCVCWRAAAQPGHESTLQCPDVLLSSHNLENINK